MDAVHQEKVQEALQQSAFHELAGIIDGAELSCTETAAFHNWPAALHILAHIYNKQLEDARFVWKRLPASAKQSTEAQASFRLLQFMWNKQYEGTWTTLNSTQWSADEAQIAQAIGQQLQSEMLDLIEKAYAAIAPAKAAVLLGASDAEAISLGSARGWELDGATNLLKVTQKATAIKNWNATASLQQLTEYMIHLEQ